MSPAIWLLLLCGLVAQAHALTKTQEHDETLRMLGRQLILQQLFVEEHIRSEGDSGIKQIRHRRQGSRPYHSDTHTGQTIMAIHTHAHYERTMGMGEFVAVLNGVEFRTRHNDYLLKMPHRTSRQYHKVEDVPFPAVPPEVLRLNTVKKQAAEMRLWFKAWKDQDHSQRDYRKYFKPVLCYLEGAWIHAGEKIEDAFDSLRHTFDATTWFDMHEKIRYTSATGTKHRMENYSFLPRKILHMNGSKPVIVQWHYRIMCHPLNKDVPTAQFRPVCERARMLAATRKTSPMMATSTRFQLNTFNTPKWPNYERLVQHQLIDSLMTEIPGKDNYPGDLTDDSFGRIAYKFEENNKRGRRPLNAAYYHRLYSEKMIDGMSNYYKYRGFADENIFMAMTSNPKVAEFSVETDCKGKGAKRKCRKSTQRWSYAIPLEIVYVTPLSSWNPYHIKYKGYHLSKLGKTVRAKGRNGKLTKERAFNGSNTEWYAITPAAFYSGKELRGDAADTLRGVIGVLTPNGNMVKTRISGFRIFMPKIAGVGILRQRWPIVPVYSDGNPIMKELQALIDDKHKCI